VLASAVKKAGQLRGTASTQADPAELASAVKEAGQLKGTASAQADPAELASAVKEAGQLKGTANRAVSDLHGDVRLDIFPAVVAGGMHRSLAAESGERGAGFPQRAL